MVDPYLPDIMKDVVNRVSLFFENQNLFSVSYDKGIYNQVGNDRIKSDLFIWLVMPFEEKRNDPDIYAEVDARLIIAAGTDANYSMQQREDINIKPKLIPVYERLIEEIKLETRLGNPKDISHTKKILPYWGGGETNGPGAANLWKECFDCIDFTGLRLKIEHKKECVFFSNI